MRINLKKFSWKIAELYEDTITDVPVNICILNEDGTATNFTVENLYTFFTCGPNGEPVANIVLKPE